MNVVQVMHGVYNVRCLFYQDCFVFDNIFTKFKAELMTYFFFKFEFFTVKLLTTEIERNYVYVMLNNGWLLFTLFLVCYCRSSSGHVRGISWLSIFSRNIH